MPRSVFLAPHNDDETLFGAGLLMRHQPFVVVCLRSMVQEQRGTGIRFGQREAETDTALTELGQARWDQWELTDDLPVAQLSIRLGKKIEGLTADFDHCFAPAVEAWGHEHHNLIGELAVETFGSERVTRYLTYTRLHGRSTDGMEVPFEPWMVERKLRALACYRSQILEPSCTEHFVGGIREHVAE